jgi:hypothetical protein
MLTADKIKEEMLIGWLLIVVVSFVALRLGRQAAEWLLMKLYELFISGKNHIPTA